MRQLGSKLIAGGLSAGMVLLWWPLFFPTDSVAMWLGRGIVWTLSFELLLVALSPFELALWSTGRGERFSQRVEAKRAMLDHDSPTRRLGRRAGLALGALALPLALIALGVSKHIEVHHSSAPKVTQVTRVVRVVRPVRVERVVKVKTVSQQVPTASVYAAPSATTVSPTTRTRSDSPRRTTAKKPASTPTTPVRPKAHAKPPSGSGQTAPPSPTSGSTTGSGTQSPTPATSPSGAAAQPTT